jgi:hypothetical protein
LSEDALKSGLLEEVPYNNNVQLRYKYVTLKSGNRCVHIIPKHTEADPLTKEYIDYDGLFKEYGRSSNEENSELDKEKPTDSEKETNRMEVEEVDADEMIDEKDVKGNVKEDENLKKCEDDKEATEKSGEEDDEEDGDEIVEEKVKVNEDLEKDQLEVKKKESEEDSQEEDEEDDNEGDADFVDDLYV